MLYWFIGLALALEKEKKEENITYLNDNLFGFVMPPTFESISETFGIFCMLILSILTRYPLFVFSLIFVPIYFILTYALANTSDEITKCRQRFYIFSSISMCMNLAYFLIYVTQSIVLTSHGVPITIFNPIVSLFIAFANHSLILPCIEKACGVGYSCRKSKTIVLWLSIILTSANCCLRSNDSTLGLIKFPNNVPGVSGGVLASIISGILFYIVSTLLLYYLFSPRRTCYLHSRENTNMRIPIEPWFAENISSQ